MKDQIDISGVRFLYKPWDPGRTAPCILVRLEQFMIYNPLGFALQTLFWRAETWRLNSYLLQPTCCSFWVYHLLLNVIEAKIYI